MKRLVLLIIPALICGIALTSCEKVEQGELYVAGVNSGTVPTSENSSETAPTSGNSLETAPTNGNNNLVFTGNDIISFNVTTGEIVFIDSKVEEIISLVSLYPKLNFFIDDKPVFVPSIATMALNGDRYCGSPLPWASLNDLGLLILNSETCFLIEGYLPWHFLSDDENDREAILKKQEENSKRRNEELKVLINYLSKTGKVVE